MYIQQVILITVKKTFSFIYSESLQFFLLYVGSPKVKEGRPYGHTTFSVIVTPTWKGPIWKVSLFIGWFWSASKNAY